METNETKDPFKVANSTHCLVVPRVTSWKEKELQSHVGIGDHARNSKLKRKSVCVCIRARAFFFYQSEIGLETTENH